MRPHILAESTGAGILRAYIESSLAFMREHRKQLIAIVEIGRNRRRRPDHSRRTGPNRTAPPGAEGGSSSFPKVETAGPTNAKNPAFAGDFSGACGPRSARWTAS
jgi:hypothetical protein